MAHIKLIFVVLSAAGVIACGPSMEAINQDSIAEDSEYLDSLEDSEFDTTIQAFSIGPIGGRSEGECSDGGRIVGNSTAKSVSATHYCDTRQKFYVIASVWDLERRPDKPWVNCGSGTLCFKENGCKYTYGTITKRGSVRCNHPDDGYNLLTFYSGNSKSRTYNPARAFCKYYIYSVAITNGWNGISWSGGHNGVNTCGSVSSDSGSGSTSDGSDSNETEIFYSPMRDGKYLKATIRTANKRCREKGFTSAVINTKRYERRRLRGVNKYNRWFTTSLKYQNRIRKMTCSK